MQPVTQGSPGNPELPAPWAGGDPGLAPEAGTLAFVICGADISSGKWWPKLSIFRNGNSVSVKPGPPASPPAPAPTVHSLSPGIWRLQGPRVRGSQLGPGKRGLEFGLRPPEDTPGSGSPPPPVPAESPPSRRCAVAWKRPAPQIPGGSRRWAGPARPRKGPVRAPEQAPPGGDCSGQSVATVIGGGAGGARRDLPVPVHVVDAVGLGLPQVSSDGYPRGAGRPRTPASCRAAWGPSRQGPGSPAPPGPVGTPLSRDPAATMDGGHFLAQLSCRMPASSQPRIYLWKSHPEPELSWGTPPGSPLHPPRREQSPPGEGGPVGPLRLALSQARVTSQGEEGALSHKYRQMGPWAGDDSETENQVTLARGCPLPAWSRKPLKLSQGPGERRAGGNVLSLGVLPPRAPLQKGEPLAAPAAWESAAFQQQQQQQLGGLAAQRRARGSARGVGHVGREDPSGMGPGEPSGNQAPPGGHAHLCPSPAAGQPRASAHCLPG
ncbi:collagen alpha-1(I) chain-like [Lynx canadensis]|uniref:collagen alpha-1(I) chain-like n=1 Tax=Lynx canadensis TaxID=61383 RepID=UPI0011B0CAC4|nr:collagen alpha-1(I) chain-like [Lynx canadensis]